MFLDEFMKKLMLDSYRRFMFDFFMNTEEAAFFRKVLYTQTVNGISADFNVPISDLNIDKNLFLDKWGIGNVFYVEEKFIHDKTAKIARKEEPLLLEDVIFWYVTNLITNVSNNGDSFINTNIVAWSEEYKKGYKDIIKAKGHIKFTYNTQGKKILDLSDHAIRSFIHKIIKDNKKIYFV